MKGRASKTFVSASLALTLSVLIAAAGPLSQTVRLVRVDPRATDYALIFSGAWTEAPIEIVAPASRVQSLPLQARGPHHKPVQSIQPFSGYWDTAAAFKAPIADVPAQPLPQPLQATAVPVPFCIALPAAESPPALIPSSRGPPRA